MTPTYDFDRIVSRIGSGDLKHCVLKERYGDADLLPLWVADMDFETPPFIVDAMKKRLEHPIFGYTIEPPELWPTVIEWIKSHHDWDVEREWLTYIPGIVKGIGLAVNFFTEPGDRIIIQPPVYHPFRMTPEGNRREVVWNPLKMNDDGSYDMDFCQLESLIKGEDTDGGCGRKPRILILSNPHNPGGTVWTADTLRRLAHICHENGLIVISDEIHSDMAIFGHRHIPFASVSDEAAMCSITFGAPSKTFNIAGIVSSYSIIPNPELRVPFYDWLTANELNEAPLFSPISTIAAFREGEAWRQAMLSYVEDNIRFVEDYCREHMPEIRPIRPQASFLVWLDCRGLGMDHQQLIDLFVGHAKLALNDGEMFGPGGEGFMRMNVGTQRSTLKEALDRLKGALDK